MNKMDVYKEIVRDTIREDLAPEDVLLYMVVLHTHSIVPGSDVPIEDVVLPHGENHVVLAPLTRNHLAELLSSLWRPDDPRGDSSFWQTLYSRLTPYELFGDLPQNLREKSLEAKKVIEDHKLVERLIEE